MGLRRRKLLPCTYHVCNGFLKITATYLTPETFAAHLSYSTFRYTHCVTFDPLLKEKNKKIITLIIIKKEMSTHKDCFYKTSDLFPQPGRKIGHTLWERDGILSLLPIIETLDDCEHMWAYVCRRGEMFTHVCNMSSSLKKMWWMAWHALEEACVSAHLMWLVAVTW